MIAGMTILRIARRTSLLLGSLSCGAWLFAVYLDHTMADPPDAVRQMLDAGIFSWLLIILGAEPAPAKPYRDPDPAIYGPAASSNFESTNDGMVQLCEKYASWDWCYGKSPAFDVSHGKRFDWGEVEINLSLQKGIIKEVKIFTDAMDVEMFDQLSQALVGEPYQKTAMATAVKESVADETAKKDLVEWMKGW